MSDKDKGGGSIIPPAGQQVIRHETAESDLARVIKTGVWLCVMLVAVFGLLLAEVLIIGPISIGAGVLVGLLVGFAIPLRRATLMRQWPRPVWLAAGMCASFVGWGVLYQRVIVPAWPPLHITWPWYIKLPVLGALLLVQGGLAWVIWRLWTEIVDPTGPTSPRIAIARDKVIVPWGRETYGGQLVQQPQPEPQRRVIEVRVHSNSGRTTHIADLPDTPQVRSFARDVLNGGSFCERDAQSAGISRNDWHEIRDAFLARGWAVWRDPDHPQQGIDMAAAGRAVMRSIRDRA